MIKALDLYMHFISNFKLSNEMTFFRNLKAHFCKIFAISLLLCCFENTFAAAPLLQNLGGASGFGNLAMQRNDDGSSGTIPLGAGFPTGIKLFAGTFANLFINNNGNITFNSPLGAYTPTPFPVTNVPMLAAFWGDVDTRGGTANPLQNNVYYSTLIPGKFIVTWDYVGYYAGATNKLNAFQIILTDRGDVAQGDFDIEFRYEQLQWTTGAASGGSNGLGGTPAQMGYDAGDGKNFYSNPDSQTAQILNLVDTSNVGEPGVWRFEVRGGTPNPVRTKTLTNVRLIQTLNNSDIEVIPSTFTIPPASIISGGGQTSIEWYFDKFLANTAKNITYEVVFKNPLPGETRLVISKLEMIYNDANNNIVKTGLGSEYVNVYPSNLTVTPSTDKPSYGAGESVLISSLVKNLSSFTGGVSVKLSIQDALQRPVAALGSLPTQTVAVGGTNTFNGLNFNVANTLAGNYRVVAELLDAGGNPIAVGAAPFVIFTAGGAQVQSSITTDKRIYAPLNNVQITDRITNTLTNTALDNLKIITTVTNPDGTVRFTKTEALLQLLPSATRDYGYTLPLTAAAAGQYNAVLTVTKADGAQLSQSTTQFTVSSSADTGAGLIGQIAVNPKIANNGQTVGLTFSATNNGNSAMANVPLTVRIVDPEKQIVVKELAFTTTLAIGGVFNQTGSWIANVLAGTNLVAVLEATVGGKQQVLAQATFTVLKLDIVQSLPKQARILVLVSCKNNDEGHNEKDDDERSCSKPENEHDEDEDHSKTCVTDRANTIKQELTALGVSHTVVTNTTEFKRAFRSGLYNTYWISGKQYKLHDDLADEIREAVFAGDRLILDGVHDERNKVLDQVAGITYRGKLGEKGLQVDTTGSLYITQHLPVVGQALKVIANGSQAVAAFEGGGLNASGPAVLTNSYGQGKAIMFAFDYVSSLRAQALWKPVLADSLQYLLPIQFNILTPGALLPVKTAITNQGAATGIQVKMTLPATAAVLGSNPTGVVDTATNSISWAFDLPALQTKDLFLTLRVPPTAGDFELQTRVSTVTDGVANLYGEPIPLAFKVVTAAQNSADVQAKLSALVLTSRKDIKLRQDLLSDLQTVMTAFNKNTSQGYETAIHEIIEMIEDMASSTAVNTPAIRLALDAILKEAQWRWSLLPTTGKRDDYEHRDHSGHR